MNKQKQKLRTLSEKAAFLIKGTGGRLFLATLAAAASGVLALSFVLPVEAATDLSSFPASYRPYIQALMNAYPGWTFEAFDTDVSWSDLLAYETQTAVNLIEYGCGENDAWYAKDQAVSYNGATINLYNYQTGNYYILSAPDWVQPTDEVIAYYLDPRNFLNDTDIFMFESLSYNAGIHTAANVDVLLEGTWMYQTTLEDDSSMTYAEAFVKIGASLGLSPFMLASRVVQEQGSAGTSPLISGTYSGYEGYYNYFNIGASGETYAEIYQNGLAEAKSNGWNTRYKALYGGAQSISARYLNYNQTTIYFQKFDVATGKVSWHQYMQNIQAPLNEGRRTCATYKECGLMNSAFVFIIPVYDDMPATACQITVSDLTGDADLNGTVDAYDALFVLQYAVGLKSFDSVQLTLGDVDGNGAVATYDALCILQYVVGLRSSL